MYQTDHQKQMLDFFQKHQEKSFTAVELLQEFQNHINKATIYRKLHSLEEQKIVRKSYDIQKKSYTYQYAFDCENHLHLICKSCGKIIHLKCEHAESFITHLSFHHGFSIDQGETLIFGICEGCKANG